jgi:hypothetical protein
VIIAEIWEFFQNVSNVEWIIGIILAILIPASLARNKVAALRRIWYPLSRKEFKVNISAEMKFPEFHEDFKAIQNSIITELAGRGTKISRHDSGNNYVNFWINNSQAAYDIEFLPDVEESAENGTEVPGTQVLVKLLSTLPFRYGKDDNLIYITLVKQLLDIIDSQMSTKPSFTNYDLQAMLSDSGISGSTIRKKEERKTNTLIKVRTNGVEGNSSDISDLFRLCKKYLPYAPQA